MKVVALHSEEANGSCPHTHGLRKSSPRESAADSHCQRAFNVNTLDTLLPSHLNKYGTSSSFRDPVLKLQA